MNRILVICDNCKSPNVIRDASARWDVTRQDWVITGTHDDSTCEDCEDECHELDVPRLTSVELNAQGISIECRDDGYYLVARFEVDEAGPYENIVVACSFAYKFRPSLLPD